MRGGESNTDDNRQGCDTSDTHHATEEPPPFSVPMFIARSGEGMQDAEEMEWTGA